MTEKLYYKNSYKKEFTAKIKDIIKIDTKFGIILDRTCFYPEGGGQPGDTGYIENEKVIDTQIDNGEVVHITKNKISTTTVDCSIDWERRFRLMQLHTGQHILSASCNAVLDADTQSVHFTDDISTLDIDIPQLDWEMIRSIEDYANDLIFQNKEVTIHWIESDVELDKFSLRKSTDKETNIRIVEIDNMDYSPCGGMHVHQTGEVGLIKIRKWGKIRNHSRIEFYCGWNALEDYRWKNKMLLDISDLLSIKDEDVQARVEDLLDENKNLIKTISKLKEQRNKYEVEQYLNKAEMINDVRLIHDNFTDRNFKDIRHITSQIIENEEVIVLFSNETNGKAQLIFACHPEMDIEMNHLIKQTCSKINGSGGGQRNFAQGGGSSDGLHNAFLSAIDSINEIIKNNLY